MFTYLLVFLAAYWGIGLAILLVASLVTKLIFTGEERSDFGRCLLGGLFRGLTKSLELSGALQISRIGVDALERAEGPLIIAPNHPALWDVLFMLDISRDAACIMKSSLFENPLLSHGARFAGFLPNSPKLRMIRGAVTHLDNGGRLLIFPEGTRSGEEGVQEFRPGIALIAKQADAPVLPVFIRTSSPYLSKGWSLLRPPTFPIRIEISVGGRQRVADGEPTREFSERLERLYRAQLSGC